MDEESVAVMHLPVAVGALQRTVPVSYTHLDVYKRQVLDGAGLVHVTGDAFGELVGILVTQTGSGGVDLQLLLEGDVYKRQLLP